MRRIYIIIILGLLALSMLLFRYSFAQEYYSYGSDEINNIRRDMIPGQLIVVSQNMVYLASSTDGSVIREYVLPFWVWDLQADNLGNSKLWGIGDDQAGVTCGNVFCINRSSGEIDSYTIGAGFHPNVLLQDETRLIVITSKNEPLIPMEDKGRVFIINKSDLSLVESWASAIEPVVGAYSGLTGLVYIPDKSPYLEDTNKDFEIPTSGDRFWSRLRCFDSNQNGLPIANYSVYGSVTSITTTNDGAIIAGIAGDPYFNDPTMAIIDLQSIEINIDSLAITSLDCDFITNRIFGATIDNYGGQQAKNGYILIWDYDTSEYEIINSGIHGLDKVTYYNDKLYGITGKDNRVYVITLD